MAGIERPRRIACLGEVMVELFRCDQDLARIGVAGDSYNTAVYLSRLLRGQGVSIDYVTALGDDAESDRIVAALEAEAIGTSCVERRPGGMPGLYMITLDGQGERSFGYWRSAAAARSLFSEPCRVRPEAMSAFDMVCLSGISLAILPQTARDRFYDWAFAWRAEGGRIAFDSNYRPGLWEDPATARRETARLWSICDLALPSLDDEMALFGDADATAVLARLAQTGVKFGALKRGACGPLTLDGTERSLNAPKVERPVDTTAAGDSFNAGFIAAYATGSDIMACMAGGHALSSRVIEFRGAIIAPAHMP